MIIAMVLAGTALSAAPPPTPAKIVAHFEGDLLLKPLADGRHMQLVSAYTFVDQDGKRWTAPPGLITDGASVPTWAWSFGLGPWDGKYRNAAIIHDWYCAHRTRSWQETDRMFYRAMLASGVDQRKAQIMYAAVLMGGPRWDIADILNERLADQLATRATPGAPKAQIIGPGSPVRIHGGKGRASGPLGPATLVAFGEITPEVSESDRNAVLRSVSSRLMTDAEIRQAAKKAYMNNAGNCIEISENSDERGRYVNEKNIPQALDDLTDDDNAPPDVCEAAKPGRG